MHGRLQHGAQSRSRERSLAGRWQATPEARGHACCALHDPAPPSPLRASPPSSAALPFSWRQGAMPRRAAGSAAAQAVPQALPNEGV